MYIARPEIDLIPILYIPNAQKIRCAENRFHEYLTKYQIICCIFAYFLSVNAFDIHLPLTMRRS